MNMLLFTSIVNLIYSLFKLERHDRPMTFGIYNLQLHFFAVSSRFFRHRPDLQIVTCDVC